MKQLIFLTLTWVFIGGATAQTVQDAGATIMDAAIGPDGAVYAAAYDFGEVWRINGATGEVAAKVSVGKGPVSLAISKDGAVIACANNLSHNVSLLHAADFAVFATVDCPKGPSQIASLPDGRFAVVSAFAGTVVLVDPAKPSQTAELKGSGSSPVSVCAGEGYVGIATRVPPAIEIYDPQSATATAQVALDEAPTQVIAAPAGKIAAVLPSKMILIDKASAKVTGERVVSVKKAVGGDDGLFALAGSAVTELDGDLQTRREIPVSITGTALAASGNFMMVLSPKTRQYWTNGAPETKPVQAPAVVVAAAPVVEPPAKPVAPVAAKPVPEPVVLVAAAPVETPAPVQQTAPAEQKKEEPAVSPNVPKPRRKAAPDAQAAQAAAAPAEPKQQEKETGGTHYRQMPLSTPDAHAPQPSRRPSASPLADVNARKTVEQGLTQDLSLQPQQPFKAPDWTQPLRDIQFDRMEGDIQKINEEMLLEGHVRLRLDTLDFAADKFWYSMPTGKMRAEGDVVVHQDQATFEAARVFYELPETSELPPRSPLSPALTEQQQAKLRLSSGVLEAYDVHVTQPEQELFADEIRYNLNDSTGHIANAHGHAGMYYFKADTLRILGPASYDGEELWVTTCDQDPPHYRIRMSKASIREGKAMYAADARLQLGKMTTPLYWPRWGYKPGQTGAPVSFDFDSGHRANIGYYVNVGQQFVINPDVRLGLRFYPTTKEGVGFGLDGDYDFRQTPSSPLFLSRGEFHSLYTTDDRGYLDFYHRQELYKDTDLRLQWEQWSDRDFYKDFYYDLYRDRTTPRTFANVTRTKPGYIATGTVRVDTHDFVTETERLPEVTYHLLERPLADRLYVSFDTVDGYVEREPWSTHAVRLVNVGRVMYDLNISQGLNVTPFNELMATYYSEQRSEDSSDVLLANTTGVTVQSRLSKVYPGFWGFSKFKHVVLPSVTYSYRPEPAMGVYEAPKFDAYDVAHGRSRIETKLDNVIFGRDEQTEEVWQVARLTLYQGNDLWNEITKAEDYEAELDLRPRPWWGWMLAAERHTLEEELDFSEPFWLQTGLLELRESITGRPYDDAFIQYDPRGGSYNRLLTYVYYDDRAFANKFNAHLGFAYTETRDDVYNREVLYGGGYQLGELWAVGFEHRYDFEQNELTRQTYEIRRNLHCWEAALQFRDRQEGWDVGLSFNVVAFPGTKLKF